MKACNLEYKMCCVHLNKEEEFFRKMSMYFVRFKSLYFSTERRPLYQNN